MITRRRILQTTVFLAVLITITGAFIGYKAWSKKQPDPSADASDILQFVSSGHVLGFQKTGVYVATGSHVLRESFAGTDGVTPQANTPPSSKGKAQPMGKVTYLNLWKGITLVYDSPPGGIMRSTYRVEPGADPNQITLKYNVPVSLDKKGNIVYTFDNGTLTASAPIAWQEINGKRVPVEVGFKLDDSKGTVHFKVAQYNPDIPLFIDPTLKWNTFVAIEGYDMAFGVAVDTGGNIFLAGIYAFVTKLNNGGETEWTFSLGASHGDVYNYGITVDGMGNVYVTGCSNTTWGNPVNPHSGDSSDAFVIKLNSSGETVWHTFMGAWGSEKGNDIVLDDSGNIYVTGTSSDNWGNPINEHSPNDFPDIFVAKLNSSGETVWNTFLGGNDIDEGKSIALDDSGNIYITGSSVETWGNPLNPKIEWGYDIVVAKLNNNGETIWHTFLGSDRHDEGNSLALDGNENIYVAGRSSGTWGNPINVFVGDDGCGDAFIVKLNNSGATVWNTFIGSEVEDFGNGIAVNKRGDIYVVGRSNATWGNPVFPFSGESGSMASEVFVAKLNTNGLFRWNGFMGSEYTEYGTSVAIDKREIIYIAGYGEGSWGNPINDHEGDLSYDAFIAKIIDRPLGPSIPVLILNPSE